jgi:hypothetical protein
VASSNDSGTFDLDESELRAAPNGSSERAVTACAADAQRPGEILHRNLEPVGPCIEPVGESAEQPRGSRTDNADPVSLGVFGARVVTVDISRLVGPRHDDQLLSKID